MSTHQLQLGICLLGDRLCLYLEYVSNAYAPNNNNQVWMDLKM